MGRLAGRNDSQDWRTSDYHVTFKTSTRPFHCLPCYVPFVDVPQEEKARSGFIIDGLSESITEANLLSALKLLIPSLAVKKITKLKKGGWFINFFTDTNNVTFLGLDSITVDDTSHKVDIHKVSTKSQFKLQQEAEDSNSIFLYIPSSKSNYENQDFVNQIKKDLDSHETKKIQLLNNRGNWKITFLNKEIVSNKLKSGISLPSVSLHLNCHPFSSRYEEKFKFCKNCLNVGHNPYQCKTQQSCRTCGSKGHSEHNNNCPQHLVHPLNYHNCATFCVHCHHSDHKAGSPKCHIIQNTRKKITRNISNVTPSSTIPSPNPDSLISIFENFPPLPPTLKDEMLKTLKTIEQLISVNISPTVSETMKKIHCILINLRNNPAETLPLHQTISHTSTQTNITLPTNLITPSLDTSSSTNPSTPILLKPLTSGATLRSHNTIPTMPPTQISPLALAKKTNKSKRNASATSDHE